MKILRNRLRGVGLSHPALNAAPAPSINAAAPRELLARCPQASATPLIRAEALAQRLGVARIEIKDERARMGLGSFKALGAAYAIACDAADDRAKGKTYVTASAGNHGLSVAAGASALGARAVVFLPETTPSAFTARLESAGADLRCEGATYEDAMDAAARFSDREGATLLSDSSWEDYFDAPLRVMEGYLVMIAEVIEEIATPPTHIFLQAGVGGMAAAVAAAARNAWGDAPCIVVVEPDAATALMRSMQLLAPARSDGPISSMGRLDCKEPSLIALKGLSRDAAFFAALSEDEAAGGAAAAEAADLPTTPSGAAGLSALVSANKADRMQLRLSDESRVLIFLTEGPVT